MFQDAATILQVNATTGLEMREMDDIGPASSIPKSEIGRAVARQIISSLDGDLPAGRPGDAIVLARAAGVTVLGIQQLTGLARQTIYRYQEQAGNPRRVERGQLRFEILVVLASRGSLTIVEIASRLAVSTHAALPAVVDLDDQGLARMDFDADADDRRALPTDTTYIELARYFNRHVDRQPFGFTVCIELGDQMDAQVIQRAADAVLAAGNQETSTVAGPEVAPSVMRGRELLLLTRAPTQRMALEFAYEAWPAILEEVDLPAQPPVIRDVFPPAAPLIVNSHCLDRFVEVLLDEGAGTPQRLRAARASFAGDLTEKKLAARCVTEAAIALRRAAGQDRNPKLIAIGDDAFDEWQASRALELDSKRERIQAPTVDALDVAAKTFGPFPGGQLGSFTSGASRPTQPMEVDATPENLEYVAKNSARAIAAADHQGIVQAEVVLERIVDLAYRT